MTDSLCQEGPRFVGQDRDADIEKGLGDTAKEAGGQIGRLGLSYRDYFIHVYALYAHIYIHDTHG